MDSVEVDVVADLVDTVIQAPGDHVGNQPREALIDEFQYMLGVDSHERSSELF